jgi:hypothetical protein
MSVESTLRVLQRIEEVVDSDRATTAQRGLSKYWERDKRFIAAARDCIMPSEAGCLSRVLDQLGPSSHGFGGYCRNPSEVNRLLEILYLELQELILSTR